MKIFKELNKLGYKHYTEHTVEELDDLPLDSEERIMEQALVLKWFRENHSIVFWYEPILKKDYTYNFFIYNEVTGEKIFVTKSRYCKEAELACLRKLIEIVKQK